MSQVIPTGRLSFRRAPSWNGRPVDYVNASQLKLVSQGCTTAWALRYLHGIESRRIQRGPLLGTLVHRAARHFYATGNPVGFVPSDDERIDLMAWADQQARKHKGDPHDWAAQLCAEAVRRFLPGIPLLPARDPELPLAVECEFRLVLDGVTFGGTTDLRLASCYGAHVWDHKTTRGKQVSGRGFDPWYYVPTVEQLSWDPQCLLYMLKCSQEAPNLHYISAQWVYYLTDDEHEPATTTRSVTLDRFEVLTRFRKKWLPWARYIADWQRWYNVVGAPPPLEAFSRVADPNNDNAACNQFGGCDFSNRVHGPCRVFNDDPAAIAYAIAHTPELAA